MNPKIKYLTLALCSIFGCLSITILFYWSESIMHSDNPFIRRYVQGCIKMHEIDLSFNSYYFAGFNDGKVILGNTTGPLHVTSVDSALTKKSSFAMELDEHGFRFMSPVLRIASSEVYLIDGTVPVIYHGTLDSKVLRLKWHGQNRFSQPQLTDSLSIICRTIDPDSQNSELASLYFGTIPQFKIQHALLEKQVDGIFDSDGILHFDKGMKKAVYTYFYRNQFIVAHPNLELDYMGYTIDTTTQARIEVANVRSRNERKLSRPPVIVNRMSALDGNLLFIASGLIGKFEDPVLWKQSSIIDVYDVAHRKYIASFYLYNIDGERAKMIAADNGRFYALIGNRMVHYRVDKLILEHYQTMH